MTKEKYAKMLNLIPHEAMQILKDEADAERLVEGIFKLKSTKSQSRFSTSTRRHSIQTLPRFSSGV
jgi:hypothetical protein